MALSLRNPSLVHAPEAHWFAPLPFLGKSTLVASSLRDILRGQTRRLHPPASPVFFCLVSTCISFLLLLLIQGAGAPLSPLHCALNLAVLICAVRRLAPFYFAAHLNQPACLTPFSFLFLLLLLCHLLYEYAGLFPAARTRTKSRERKKSAKKKQRFRPAPRGPLALRRRPVSILPFTPTPVTRFTACWL